jgi:hypothetical protein
MAMTNAEKQAAWRARRDEELRNLRVQVLKLEGKVRKLTQEDMWRKFHLDSDERKHTAYHEAGHAVIGLAVQLPVAYAVSVPSGRAKVGHVGMAHECNRSIGPGYRLIDVGRKAAELDAFGNVPRERVWSLEEHHAEVIMCLAGPMAEAKLRNQEWRGLASSSDMNIARHHRGELGDSAESWEEYEREATALVDKHWPMIEAVAARLMKVDWISGHEVDEICCRVARRQHFTKLRNQNGAVE